MAEDLLYCKSSDYIMILARILGAENSSLRIKQRLESRLEVYTAPREKCYNSTSWSVLKFQVRTVSNYGNVI